MFKDDRDDSQLTMSTTDEDIASDIDSSTVSSVASAGENTSVRQYQRRSCTIPSLKKSMKFEKLAINEKRNSWKALPPPDMKEIHRKLADHYSRSLSSRSLILVEGKTSSHRRARVTFDQIQFRVYGQTVGDNPAVSSGVPISLDWKFEDTDPVDVQAYEANRGQRRPAKHLVLNPQQRHMMLKMHYRVTNEQMNNAIHDVERAQQQRAKSNRTYLPSISGMIWNRSSLSPSAGHGVHHKMDRIQALATVGYK